jgi:hypothetical protein
MNEDVDEVTEEIDYETIVEFFESTPPNRVSHISDLSIRKAPRGGGYVREILNTPEIQLHCPSENCNGVRFFRCVLGREVPLKDSYEYLYVTYRCSNCQNHKKTYAIAAKLDDEDVSTGELYKFGELPTYGPPTPPRFYLL